MTYALNLAEDGRILSAGIYHVEPSKGVVVVDKVLIDEIKAKDTKAERRVTNYRYVDGVFIYDPLPEREKTTAQTLAERVAELEAIIKGITQ